MADMYVYKGAIFAPNQRNKVDEYIIAMHGMSIENISAEELIQLRALIDEALNEPSIHNA